MLECAYVLPTLNLLHARDPIQSYRLCATVNVSPRARRLPRKRKQFAVNVLRGALCARCYADKPNADTCTQRQRQSRSKRERETEREGQTNSFSQFELNNLVAFCFFIFLYFFSPLLFICFLVLFHLIFLARKSA